MNGTNEIAGLFVSGGPVGMSLVTIVLIALFFAAWKAPAWVEELGIIAMVLGCAWAIAGICQLLGVLQERPGIAVNVIAGGIKCTLIPLFYGLAVYLVSLVIRIVQKPRL